MYCSHNNTNGKTIVILVLFTQYRLHLLRLKKCKFKRERIVIHSKVHCLTVVISQSNAKTTHSLGRRHIQFVRVRISVKPLRDRSSRNGYFCKRRIYPTVRLVRLSGKLDYIERRCFVDAILPFQGKARPNLKLFGHNLTCMGVAHRA